MLALKGKGIAVAMGDLNRMGSVCQPQKRSNDWESGLNGSLDAVAVKRKHCYTP
jgi:hypothetical protein